MATRRKPLMSFKAFLSHRYKSPQINEYFFSLFSRVAEVQFEIDEGTKPTNVTRLERLVRDADAFIGIYPFPSEEHSPPDRSAALTESRYFRLELDLAIRSRRPAIVFVDSWYGNAITVSPPIIECRFDHHELLGSGISPQEAKYVNAFKAFIEMVSASMKLELSRSRFLPNRSKVGILLPTTGSVGAYTNRHFEMMENCIRLKSQTPVRLPEQPIFDGDFFRLVEEFDWLIADISKEACNLGLVSYFHGCFVPMIRLVQTVKESSSQTSSPLERTLLGSHEVGYAKDIVRWYDDTSLEAELSDRLAVLYEPRHRIRTLQEACAYFSSAALRKEAVFVSYSGADRDLAKGLIRVLTTRFQKVFDYRDKGESIIPGRPWLEEIFARLSVSAIGVPLLSESYFSSGNCQHEGQEMMALRDAGKITVIPIKLREGELNIPAWLRGLQYVRLWEYEKPEEAMDALIGALVSLRSNASS